MDNIVDITNLDIQILDELTYFQRETQVSIGRASAILCKTISNFILKRDEVIHAELLRRLSERDTLKAENEKLRAVLKAARDSLDPTLPFPDKDIDELVKSICDIHGYGAVMCSASRQWEEKVGSGAFTVGDCYTFVRKVAEQTDNILSTSTPSNADKNPESIQ